jgi:hypothetical protein
MLFLVMVTYNDMPFVQTAVESVYDRVDHIIAVDGRYKDFPGDEDFSTDGTVQYLRSLNKATVFFAPGMTEVEKRNEYLVGRKGDWYLHLDTDEEWTGDIKIPDADMCICWMAVDTTPNRNFHNMKRIRLFRHVDGLHYEDKHYWLKDQHGQTFSRIEKPGHAYTAFDCGEVHLLHHEGYRSPERFSAKQKYYKTLYKVENNIREYS